MQVYNINYEEIFDKETCLPELDSPSFNPVFNFRRELRKDHIDPTSVVLFTVVTIDKATNETRIVGYAAVPLFITAGPNPVHPSVQNVPVRNNQHPLPYLPFLPILNLSLPQGLLPLQRSLLVAAYFTASQANCALFDQQNVNKGTDNSRSSSRWLISAS